MNRTLLSFITFIFLFVAYSIDAQEYDWARKAVELERTVFLAEDPDAANEALVAKAVCYREAGLYSDACSTLDRIKMYMLPPEKQDAILLEKAICFCLDGDTDAAMSVLDQRASSDPELASAVAELKKEFDASHKTKSEKAATALSFLPPLGQWYTRHYGAGLKSLVTNAAAAGWTVWQCLGGYWITGLLGGGIALNQTFMGNIDSSAQYVDEYNNTVRSEWNEALERLLINYSSGR